MIFLLCLVFQYRPGCEQFTPEDRQAPPRHLQARALAKGGPEPSSSILHHLNRAARVMTTMPIVFIFVLFPSRSSHESRAAGSTRGSVPPNTIIVAVRGAPA